jgi:hypothetical protein
MKPVLLQCSYLAGRYPHLGPTAGVALKFESGQATITSEEQLKRIQKSDEWGKSIGLWGQLRNPATANRIQVVKGEPALSLDQLKALTRPANVPELEPVAAANHNITLDQGDQT